LWGGAGREEKIEGGNLSPGGFVSSEESIGLSRRDTGEKHLEGEERKELKRGNTFFAAGKP